MKEKLIRNIIMYGILFLFGAVGTLGAIILIGDNYVDVPQEELEQTYIAKQNAIERQEIFVEYELMIRRIRAERDIDMMKANMECFRENYEVDEDATPEEIILAGR